MQHSATILDAWTLTRTKLRLGKSLLFLLQTSPSTITESFFFNFPDGERLVELRRRHSRRPAGHYNPARRAPQNRFSRPQV